MRHCRIFTPRSRFCSFIGHPWPTGVASASYWVELVCLLAVHAWNLFLKVSADVGAPAFQGGREKAVGDTKHLWMQVKVLHLRQKGEASKSVKFSHFVTCAFEPRWVCTSMSLLTCSNEFSRASLPTAFMSSKTAFLTSCWRQNQFPFNPAVRTLIRWKLYSRIRN